MTRKCTVDNFDQVLIGIFEEYGEAVMDGTRKAVDTTAKEMVKETKETAPKRALNGRPAGTFAKHISSKVLTNTQTAYSQVWYVKSPEYPLAHLLNNGHALRQGGHWGGVPFITNAAQTHSKNFEKRIEEVIRDASR